MRRRNNITHRLLRPHLPIAINIRHDFRTTRHRQTILRRFTTPASNFFFRVHRQCRNISGTRVRHLFYIMLATRRPSFSHFFLPSSADRMKDTPTTIRKASFQTDLARSNVVYYSDRITRRIRGIAATSKMTDRRHSGQFQANASLALRIRRIRIVCTKVVFVTTMVAARFLIAAKTRHFVTYTDRGSRTSVIIVAHVYRYLSRLFCHREARNVTRLQAVGNSFYSAINKFFVAGILRAFKTIIPFGQYMGRYFVEVGRVISFDRGHGVYTELTVAPTKFSQYTLYPTQKVA